MKDNAKRSDLFGLGISLYGFANLVIWHPRDFFLLIKHIFSDYLFEQYKPAYAVSYIDSEIESKIDPQPHSIKTYLSFIPFLVGSLGFIKWQFGNKTREDICLFMADIKNLFSDAGFVFENAPTKLRLRQSPGVGLKVLHFLDRPRNCFPSLHVIIAAYSYLKTKELINKYSSEPGSHSRENNFLLGWSVKIIESCLLTKQHGLRDIAGGLAVVSVKFPQFARQDLEEIINLIFSTDEPRTGNWGESVRQEIHSTYSSLIAEMNENANYRDALVGYIKRI